MTELEETKPEAEAVPAPKKKAKKKTPPAPEPLITLRFASIVYAALALLYFSKAFAPGALVYGTDYLAAGYVSYDFAARQLHEGHLPTWLPHVFGGLPFYANPGSTYHPVHLLASLLLPTAKILPVVLVAQTTVSGIGTYLLLRELRAREWVAFVSGLSYQFTGVVLSWVYAGHDGRIIVATTAPLVLALLHRGARTGELPAYLGAAAALGTALLSFQIQNCWYLLVASAALTAFVLLRSRKTLERRELARRAVLALCVVATAFAVAAVNFLPFASFVSASPRAKGAGRGYEYSTTFSASPEDFIGLAVPEEVGATVNDPNTDAASFPPYRGANGFKLHTEYVGAFALLLVLVAARKLRRDPNALFFAGLALFAVTLALGRNTPLYQLYFAVLPGISRFRAPDLAFYIVALSLTVLAGLALESLAATPKKQAEVRPLLYVAGAFLLVIAGFGLYAWQHPITGADHKPVSSAMGYLRFGLFLAAVTAVLQRWLTKQLEPRHMVAALAVVITLDTWIIGRRFFFLAPVEAESFGPDEVVGFLEAKDHPDRADGRIWALPVPAPYRAGASYLMHFGLDQVGGEHSVPLQRFVEVFGTSTKQRVDWHNIIIRADAIKDDKNIPAIGLEMRRALLDASGVRWVITKMPTFAPELKEVFRSDHAIVYENMTALKRAYLVPNVKPVATAQASLDGMLTKDFDPAGIAYIETNSSFGIDGSAKRGSTEIVESRISRTVVKTDADGPALLVLADNHYEGWTATVDDIEVPIVIANHTFRGVPLSAGPHRIVFEFRPTALYIGLAISLATTGLLAFAAWRLLAARRRHLESPA